MGNQLGNSANESIRIVMVGKTGAGKSATGNTILRKQCFKSEFSPQPLTTVCEKIDGEVYGQKVAVIDTPDLFDTKNTEEKTVKDISQCISYAFPGPHIFLIVIKLDRFTEEEKQMMQMIQKIFGEEANKYSMVLFTHGDLLKGKSIEEFLKDSEELKELVAKCNGHYHVFNNGVKDRSQVKKLLEKIKKIKEENGENYYTDEIFQKAKRAIEEEKQRILKEKEEENRKEQEELRKKMEEKMSEVGPPASRFTPPAFNNDESIRIVMVGKTGAGKSATGNTILRKQCFKSECCPKTLTTGCKKVFGEVDGQWVAIIDTPGLFDTRNTKEKTDKDITQCIAYASPGPHIFLIIIKLGRFTEEEKQAVQKIQKTFGEEADKYSMVLFTHGDLLKGKSIEEFLKESKDLQELVDKCNGQYHVFNNEMEDRSQVSKLFEKIRNINSQNGGIYDTTELLQKAESVIEEKKQQILKEKEEPNHKELEELRRGIEEKYEQQMRKERADRERENELRDAQQNHKEQEEKNQKLWSEISPVSSASSNKPPTVYKNDELIRIVMVGKTGAGKSASGNTILGQKCFEADFTFKSLTQHCDKAFDEVDGQKVAVIDTPGLFDTKSTEEKTAKDITQSISYAAPGPHIFLVVIKLGRFTEEEKQTVQKIQEIFGEEADKYSMVLFTHGDLLKGKPIEEFLKKSKDLQQLVAKCYGQYHVFNNEVKDRFQVKKLLEKIRDINEQNGGSYYTNEMLQNAERVIEEKKQQILKEKEEQNHKEREELRKEIEEKYEQLMKAERDDRESENKLRDAREKEMLEKIENLKKEQVEQARQEAEKSQPVIFLIGAAIAKLCRGFLETFTK